MDGIAKKNVYCKINRNAKFIGVAANIYDELYIHSRSKRA